jgi:lysozyme
MTTSRGLDVSAYQGIQDWAGLAHSGLTFAFAKASEGQHSRDQRFDTHIAGIIKAGLIPGAYHYGWPTQSPAAESANYIAAVRPYARRGFIHVLDLERRTDGANYAGRSHAQIRAWAVAWITAVAAAFPGQRVGIYTSGDDIASGHLPGNEDFLWYPAYPSGAMSHEQAEQRPQPAPSGKHPLFWQFTSTPVDRSLAYLSPAALRAWANGDTAQPHPEDTMALTDADVEKILSTRMDDPTKPGTGTVTVRGALWAAYGQANRAAALAATAQAQVGALAAAVAALARDGGLPLAQVQAAAEAGARAALAELGDALTPDGP